MNRRFEIMPILNYFGRQTCSMGLFVERISELKRDLCLFLLDNQKRQQKIEDIALVGLFDFPLIFSFPMGFMGRTIAGISITSEMVNKPVYQWFACVGNAYTKSMAICFRVVKDRKISFSINNASKICNRFIIHAGTISHYEIAVNYIMFNVQRLSRKGVRSSDRKCALPLLG